MNYKANDLQKPKNAWILFVLCFLFLSLKQARSYKTSNSELNLSRLHGPLIFVQYRIDCFLSLGAGLFICGEGGCFLKDTIMCVIFGWCILCVLPLAFWVGWGACTRGIVRIGSGTVYLNCYNKVRL